MEMSANQKVFYLSTQKAKDLNLNTAGTFRYVYGKNELSDAS